MKKDDDKFVGPRLRVIVAQGVRIGESKAASGYQGNRLHCGVPRSASGPVSGGAIAGASAMAPAAFLRRPASRSDLFLLRFFACRAAAIPLSRRFRLQRRCGPQLNVMER